jgi:hypothetical protein
MNLIETITIQDNLINQTKSKDNIKRILNLSKISNIIYDTVDFGNVPLFETLTYSKIKYDKKNMIYKIT